MTTTITLISTEGAGPLVKLLETLDQTEGYSVPLESVKFQGRHDLLHGTVTTVYAEVKLP